MKRNMSVRSKLLISFIAFSVFVILVLWILEIVFLDEVYRAIKINSVHTAAREMMGMSDEEFEDFVVEKAASVGLCTSIYDEQLRLVAGEHAGGQCVVHNIPLNSIAHMYGLALQSEGNRFENYLSADTISDFLRKSEHINNFYNRFFWFGRDEFSEVSSNREANDCVLFGQVIENSEGELRFILLSSVIIPVESTVQTIRFELNLVVGTLIVLSIAMAYFLSQTISRPIVQINRAAKNLPEGRFEEVGKMKGYREVEELSNTLKKAAEEIQKVDRLGRELIANVSHDLRTPLTLISGYSEAMRDLPGENTPENLQIVIDETHRLSELVTDLLDLSKLQAGMEVLNREEIELVSFVQKILKRYEKMTGFQGYTITFENHCKSAFIFADPVKLNQVVYNLVNNAVNYCGEDRLVIVRLSEKDGRALVEIIDHGKGIEREKLDDIWDRYYRVETNHTSAVVGTGLGLSIVKRVLTLHQAQFGVESKLGEGSYFWFSFPLMEQSEKREL